MTSTPCLNSWPRLGASSPTVRRSVPSWLVTTPEGSYLIITDFDPDNPEQRKRVLFLVSRFMMWKLAISFVLTAETFTGSRSPRSAEEAIFVVGISRHERIGVLQRIRRRDKLSLANPEWLTADQIDESYSGLLPSGVGEITVEEIAELSAVFGEGGEMAAERLS